MTKTVCDRCGKVLVTNRIPPEANASSQPKRVVVELCYPQTAEVFTRTIASASIDLCEDCKDALVAFIKARRDRTMNEGQPTPDKNGSSGISMLMHRAETESRIWAHYEHAREKHPHFCDWLRPVHNDVPDPALMLDRLRRLIDKDGKSGMLCWETLVACENWEVIDAIVHGNYDSAVEECFDCIAVLLRVIDVLEGRQKLGKPEDAQCK